MRSILHFISNYQNHDTSISLIGSRELQKMYEYTSVGTKSYLKKKLFHLQSNIICLFVSFFYWKYTIQKLKWKNNMKHEIIIGNIKFCTGNLLQELHELIVKELSKVWKSRNEDYKPR